MSKSTDPFHLPEPVGYLEDGTAIHSFEDWAAQQGLSAAEAAELWEAFVADSEAKGLADCIVSDEALIHGVQ